MVLGKRFVFKHRDTLEALTQDFEFRSTSFLRFPHAHPHT